MSVYDKWGTNRVKAPIWAFLECGIYLLVIFLCVGESVPGINESHYLPKAKHLWDSSFAPGDLFLQSHDSHFLASALAGWAASWLPMLAVAWLGRIISWGLLAWAWLILCQRIKLPMMLRPFALATWLLGIHFGHWAGEWVAGGFEAKTIAYPLVVCGLAQVVSGNWKWVWLAMGGAMAWHPIVGAWAGLSAGCVWLLQGQLRQQLPKQLPWLVAGAALALVGVVPAAAGLGGPDVVDKVSAAQVHVFLRLPHHLAPQLFAAHRHWAAAMSLSVFIMTTLLFTRRTFDKTSPESNEPALRAGLERLLLCGWMAVLFALIGLVIDWLLSVPRPDIAARLLRFYWFRWSDVAIPLISSLLIWKWLAQGLPTSSDQSVREASSRQAALAGRTLLPVQKVEEATGKSARVAQDTTGRSAHVTQGGSSWISQSLLAMAVTLTLLITASRSRLTEEPIIPAADRLVVDSVGKYPIQTDRYVDWLAVCQWIREHTPADSLWLTPKYQQSFKWHAQRAEVVCWKDVPQDNASVIEWYHRIERCAPPRDRDGRIRDWTTAELLELSAEYGFRWILIDRTYQSQPPALEIMYPLIEHGEYIDNRSFAVLHIPDALLPPNATPTVPLGR